MKYRLVLISLITATCFISLCILGHALTSGAADWSSLNRLFVLLGGNFLKGGYIQYITYFAFTLCMLEIWEELKFIKEEQKTLGFNYLPTKSNHILLANDIIDLFHKMNDLERRKKNLLSDIIKKACIKFKVNRSLSEMMSSINTQVDINRERSDSNQSNIRYLNWGIPSLGFIGTVLGISSSLKYANSGDMEMITSLLGVAFDTTLISLILSIIVMGFLHYLQKQTDQLHTGMQEYVHDNLVNRVEL